MFGEEEGGWVGGGERPFYVLRGPRRGSGVLEL